MPSIEELLGTASRETLLEYAGRATIGEPVADTTQTVRDAAVQAAHAITQWVDSDEA